MKFFREDCESTADPQAEWRDYVDHIRSPKNNFSKNIVEFVDAVNLHDFVCSSATIHLRSRRVVLLMREPWSSQESRCVSLQYKSAWLSQKNIAALQRLTIDGRYTVMRDEFDVLDEGDFCHRIQMAAGDGSDGIAQIGFREFSFKVNTEKHIPLSREFVVK